MQAMLGEGKGQVPWLDQQACLRTPGCTNMAVKMGSQAQGPGTKISNTTL